MSSLVFRPPSNPLALAQGALGIMALRDQLQGRREAMELAREERAREQQTRQLLGAALGGDPGALQQLQQVNPDAALRLSQVQSNLDTAALNRRSAEAELGAAELKQADVQEKLAIEKSLRSMTLMRQGIDQVRKNPESYKFVIGRLKQLGVVDDEMASRLPESAPSQDELNAIDIDLQAMQSTLAGPEPKKKFLEIQQRIEASGIDPSSKEGQRIVQRELNADLLNKELQNEKLRAEAELKRAQAEGESMPKQQPIPTLVLKDIAEINTAIDVVQDLLNEWDDETGFFSAITQFIPGTSAIRYKDKRAMAAQVIGASMEPGGRMSNEDFQKYLAMMPTPGDGKERVQSKVNKLSEMLKMRKRSLTSIFGEPGSAPSSGGGEMEAVFENYVRSRVAAGVNENQAIQEAMQRYPEALQ